MFTRIADSIGWLTDYLRWRGASGAPLAMWHLAFCALAPAGRRIRAPLAHGRTVRLRARSDDLDAYRKIVVQGEYDLSDDRAAEIDRRVSRALAMGRRPLIIDAGGEVGLFAQLAARRWPRAEVLCVEPGRGDLAMARRNCSGLTNVRFRNAAIWGAADRMSGADRPGIDRSHEAVSLDQLLDERPEHSLVLLKLDVDDAASPALDPRSHFWDHRPVLVIEPHELQPRLHGSLDDLLSQTELQDSDWEMRDESLFIFPANRPGDRPSAAAPLAAAV